MGAAKQMMLEQAYESESGLLDDPNDYLANVYFALEDIQARIEVLRSGKLVTQGKDLDALVLFLEQMVEGVVETHRTRRDPDEMVDAELYDRAMARE